jgi:PPK2 family polyphosphate:nucleotide phosphotransferase
MPQLKTTNLNLSLTKRQYRKLSEKNLKQLVETQQKMFRSQVPVILIFEGWDAAGKGGAIRRLLKHIDPRGYHLYAIGAPTQDELSHHYLRRFWTKLPSRGRIAVFDRSWYGRVLVERVEEFAPRKAWKHAYKQINDFEKLLADDGYLIIKFFLHISKAEQKRRFEERERDPLKSWKMTSEDYRNRRKWNKYEEAINDMLRLTHKEWAPWHVIPANDKRYARIAVRQHCVKAFQKRLRKAGNKDKGVKLQPALLAAASV